MTEVSFYLLVYYPLFILLLNIFFFYTTEIFKRILQVVLKIRYNVESLDQKLQQMKKKIQKNGLTKTSVNE